MSLLFFFIRLNFLHQQSAFTFRFMFFYQFPSNCTYLIEETFTLLRILLLHLQTAYTIARRKRSEPSRLVWVDLVE